MTGTDSERPAMALRARLRQQGEAFAELQPGIHRLALERQDAEGALVDAAEGLAVDEALEPLQAQGELAQREGALAPEVPGPAGAAGARPGCTPGRR